MLGAMPAAEDVRRFYDDNTRLMLGLGQGTEGTIRRAVWGPGVSTRRQAMRYVDDLILERIGPHLEVTAEPRREPHVVDLGCGVCASLCRICADVGPEV
jgi:hypothetical protein